MFGSGIGTQAIEAGELDELIIHIAPILLGAGVRLYGSPAAKQVKLERLELGSGEQVTDLRFRVSAGE